MDNMSRSCTCCSFCRNHVAVYSILVVYLISSLTLGECVQITLSHIDRPYFVRYINSSMAIVLFLFPLYYRVKTYTLSRRSPPKLKAIELMALGHVEHEDISSGPSKHPQSDSRIVKGSRIHFLCWTIIGTVLHTGGGFLYYLSLQGTTIPTSFTLSKLRAVWVYMLSVIFLREICSFWKFLSVALCFLGVACYMYQAANVDDDSVDTIWGCVALLCCGVCWSVYDIFTNVIYKKYFPNFKYYGSLLYEALIGFWTIFIFWFVLFVQQPIFVDDEASNDSHWFQWKWILITGFMLTATNAAYYVALNVTSPVFTNYASFLEIPLSFVVDLFVHNYQITVLPVCGAFLIVLGFVMLEIVSEPPWFKRMMSSLKTKTNIFNSGTVLFDQENEQIELEEQSRLTRPIMNTTVRAIYFHGIV